jgi:predicted transcriptional regulator
MSTQCLIDILKEIRRESQTTGEISKNLNRCPTDVRRSLLLLVNNGIAVVTGTKTHKNKKRADRYGLHPNWKGKS